MLTLRSAVLLAYVTCLWPSVYSDGDQYSSASKQNGLYAEEAPAEKVSDLQIGCEEGYTPETPTEEKKTLEEKARKARSYYYRIQTPTSIVSVWKPAYYRIQRPYFIPVYGADGQIPFYFPPQPIFINPGFPIDNPPFRGGVPPHTRPGAGYLPPKVDTTTEKDMFDNRFGEEYPVWDTSPSRPTQPPQIVPTRRPKPSRTTTIPPLVHNPATSTVPPPPSEDFGSGKDVAAESTQTTPRPSQCVWAIINCCAAGSQTVSNSCFERFACPGPFWDRSPCESDFARIAIQTALEYYGNK